MTPTTDQPQSYQTVVGMYADYFMDYASYVILERAVPHINDGLKPVQRRILHAMDRIDDGRYNKVANIVGDTMKYHPHGDASIGDALVGLGQKKLLIDTQGNWGNILTGDPAAAPRYIEARLTSFAREVVFSPKVTEWQLSYDGRNKEPVTLPIKFPLLLAQGAEGIAVGLACKILPHNFNELIDAAIAHLRNEDFTLLPDFPTGGVMDATDYRDGDRGAGRVKIRAKLVIDSKKLIRVVEVPYGVSTDKLIESVITASEKGKIKIAKIEDNTAKNADILIHLPSGADPEQIKKALFAFTDCEVSISPNACVIMDNKPHFMGVSDILRYNADSAKNILRQELELQLRELQQEWHKASLEKIFIENRIYLSIEDCETWESVLDTIDRELQPFLTGLKAPVTRDDIISLTEIKIKRISKFDASKAEDILLKLEDAIAQTEKNLAQLTRYTIKWFEGIKKKYGANFPRKTGIEEFDTVHRSMVAAANETLSIDEDGFAGYGIKKGAIICKCSSLDDIVIVDSTGVMKIVRVQDKFFAGKNPLYINVLKKDDDPIINLIYRDGRDGALLAKRFRIGGFTRDKEYPLTQGTKGSRIFHFSVHDSEEESSAISVNIYLKAILKLKNLRRPYSFAELRIKNRNSLGNIVTKHQVERVSRIMNIAKTDDDSISIETTIKTTPTPVQSPTSDEDTLQQGSLEI
ncbi:MAG: DNA gyrase/topoisomerase IV subunit A [Akkermansia sp.]